MFGPGANDYIQRVRDCLNGPFDVINQPTRLGLLDVLRKLPRTDTLYLNWIDDVVDRKLGYLQIVLLLFVLVCCWLTGKQVVWFIHNNTSHNPRNWKAKQVVAALMRFFADTILSHAPAEQVVKAPPGLQTFDHPVGSWNPVVRGKAQYDLLVWGTVSPYKGIIEFLRLHAAHPELRQRKVLVAGRFVRSELYEEAIAVAAPTAEIRNEAISEAELQRLMGVSRSVLFCYHSQSVLSSGALARSLSYGCQVIGPPLGCFAALADKNIIFSYRDADDLNGLLERIDSGAAVIDRCRLEQYALEQSWEAFGSFLEARIKRADVSFSPVLMNQAR